MLNRRSFVSMLAALPIVRRFAKAAPKRVDDQDHKISYQIVTHSGRVLPLPMARDVPYWPSEATVGVLVIGSPNGEKWHQIKQTQTQ